MKSNIPWNNYIMRKYGLSIKAKIAELAIDNLCKVKVLNMLSEVNKTVDNGPVWGITKPGKV